MKARVETQHLSQNSQLRKKSQVDDETNYSFILKCLGALTAAALITAGALALIAAKSGAATAAGLAFGAVATASAAPIVLPIIGVFVLFAAICTLPFLFSGSSTYTTVNRPVYGGGYGYRSPYYSPTIFTPVVTTGGIFGTEHHHDHGGGHHHGHVDVGGGHHHGHGGGHVEVGGHQHGHR